MPNINNLIFYIIIFVIFLLIHHRWKHRNEFRKHPARRWFQWKDVNNHETVEMFLIGLVIGLIISQIL